MVSSSFGCSQGEKKLTPVLIALQGFNFHLHPSCVPLLPPTFSSLPSPTWKAGWHINTMQPPGIITETSQSQLDLWDYEQFQKWFTLPPALGNVMLKPSQLEKPVWEYNYFCFSWWRCLVVFGSKSPGIHQRLPFLWEKEDRFFLFSIVIKWLYVGFIKVRQKHNFLHFSSIRIQKTYTSFIACCRLKEKKYF